MSLADGTAWEREYGVDHRAIYIAQHLTDDLGAGRVGEYGRNNLSHIEVLKLEVYMNDYMDSKAKSKIIKYLKRTKL